MLHSKRLEGARMSGETRPVASGLLAFIAAASALFLSGTVCAGQAAGKIHLNPLSSAPASEPAVAGAKPGTALAAPADLSERLRNALAAAQTGNGGNARLSGASPARAASPLSARLGVDVDLVARPRVGTPMQIRGERLAVRIDAAVDPDLATARSFLQANRALLKLEDPEREVALTDRQEDNLGYRHLKFEQRYRGLRVWPAEMIVHLDRQGNVSHFDGACVPTPGSQTDPIVTGAAAPPCAGRGAERRPAGRDGA